MFIQLLINAWTSAWTVCGLINVCCCYYEWLYAQSPSGLIAVYVHDMSRGTSLLMVFHTSLSPRLLIFHVLCYSTSRESEDFHGNFLNVIREYLHVTMRGPPLVGEVTLELYRTIARTPCHIVTKQNFSKKTKREVEKEMKSQPNHPWCKIVMAKNLKGPCWKRCEIKMGGQGLLLLIESKFLIMMTRPQNIVATCHYNFAVGKHQ